MARPASPNPANPDPTDTGFIARTVHKRDMFSETVSGHLEGDPDCMVVLRRLDVVALAVRPVAWALARREVRALRAVAGIIGVPTLIRVDRVGILRSWTMGTPLHLARPDTASWYADARRLLREMRRRGVTHNDLAKPQNWLATPEGRAAVIDFQLSHVHRRRGMLFRLMAYEDLRHLLKQKRTFAPALMTPTERRMVARRSLPSRIWRATGKRLYNLITRRLMRWSDGEGTGDRLALDGPPLRAALLARDGVRDVALSLYALPARGVGLYAFVETDLSAAEIRRAVPARRAELVQPVATLPRRADGTTREDILALIATNRLDEVAALLADAPELTEAVAPIIAGRLNLTDRILRRRATPPPV